MSEHKPEAGNNNQVDIVLQDYLNDLLVAATANGMENNSTASGDYAVRAKTAPEPAEAKTTVYAEQPLPLTTLPLTVPEIKTETPVEEIPVATEEVIGEEVVTETEEALQTQVEESDTAMPLATQTTPLNWRSVQGIECLIFKVAGLKLAIPLPLLGGVHNVADKVTPLFGQARWSLGIWQGDEGKMTIIDSAQLIMPERNVSLADEGYSFFIQLDRSPWALACQEICDTVTLVYDSIKWRGETSKRPWLAGTVISEMCALVDVPGLMSLLEENVRRH